MSAALWCKEHVPAKTIVHQMSDIVNKEGLNALQLYARKFKQADKSVTDTVRKANMFATAAKGSSAPAFTGLRRPSTVAPTTNGGTVNHRHDDDADDVETAQSLGIRICVTCGVDVSPKWWSVDDNQDTPMANGYHDDLGSEAQKFVEQRKSQCHKCHKTNRKPKSLMAPPPSPPQPPSEQDPMTMAGHAIPSPPTQAVASLASIASSPRMRQSESERAPEYRPYIWREYPPPHHVGLPGVPPPGSRPPPPPSSLPQQGAHVGHINGSSSMASVHQYPTAVPFNDWHSRPSTQHGSPGRPMNGEPPLQPSPIASLSALRPPPLSGPPPHPPSLSAGGAPGGHPLGQSVLNGLPPSPRRAGGPPPAPASPYVHTYHPHHSHPPVSHGLSNGTPPQPPPTSLPPRAPDQHSHSQGFLQHRTAYGPPHASPPPHGSPPRSMDGPPPPRPPDNRPPGGASASPSLRNLLI